MREYGKYRYRLKTKNGKFYGYQYRYTYYENQLSSYFRFIEDEKLIIHHIYTDICNNVYIEKRVDNITHKLKCTSVIDGITNIENFNYKQCLDHHNNCKFTYDYMCGLIEKYKI